MDKKNKISTFETIGWAEPHQAQEGSAITYLKNLNFETNVYPDHLIDEKKHPNIVFVPDKSLMQTMILAVTESNDRTELLHKFCDMEHIPVVELIDKRELFKRRKNAGESCSEGEEASSEELIRPLGRV